MPNRSADIYVCRDAEDEIIYIGCSTNLHDRLVHHRSSTPWWTDVARVESFHFDDIAIAEQRQADAVASVRPMHNQRYVNRNYDGNWVRPARYTRRNGDRHARYPRSSHKV